jgi:predicted regulator of Ras-like GTPase activity (Roadblock/LC7/MglB family)
MPVVVLDQPSTTDRPAPNIAADPLATFPRRIRGVSGDGRSWELLTSRTGVAVVGETGPVAEAQVAEETDRVVVDIHAELFGVPADVVSRLVGEAFAHPAVRARRPILVTLPRGDSAVLHEVEAHVDCAQSRVAGVTCLIEGRVRAAR